MYKLWNRIAVLIPKKIIVRQIIQGYDFVKKHLSHLLKLLWLEVMLSVGSQMWCCNQNKGPKQIDEPRFILGFILTMSEVWEFITRNVNTKFSQDQIALIIWRILYLFKRKGSIFRGQCIISKNKNKINKSLWST